MKLKVEVNELEKSQKQKFFFSAKRSKLQLQLVTFTSVVSNFQPSASSLPTALAVVGNELAIAWSDGTEQFVSLCVLREACPCAVCEGEPDVMGNKIALKKQLTPESFVLKKYEFVGGYGIQFFWGDGHSAGIYSVGYLKNLGEHTRHNPPPKVPGKELEAIHEKMLAAAAEIHPDDWK